MVKVKNHFKQKTKVKRVLDTERITEDKINDRGRHFPVDYNKTKTSIWVRLV